MSAYKAYRCSRVLRGFRIAVVNVSNWMIYNLLKFYQIGRVKLNSFTSLQSFAPYIARMTGSWATMLGVCREFSKHNLCMLHIINELRTYNAVLVRLVLTKVIIKQTYMDQQRKGKKSGPSFVNTPPCHLHSGFPLTPPSRKNYIPSPTLVPTTFFIPPLAVTIYNKWKW